MSKDYTVVFPISRECAHQVAMTAAEAAARIASPSTVDMDRLGEAVAKAYLQAYEAVEGWTRPPVPVAEPVSTIPHVSLHYGQSVSLFIINENRYVRLTLSEHGSWRFDQMDIQPKDA